MKRAAALGSFVSCLLAFHSATAGEVANLVTFMPGTPARAAEVNGNFAAVKAAVDDNHARIGNLDGRVTALENADDALGQIMYGDGSAGDLVVSGSVSWLSSEQPTNINFNDCTIHSGSTLIVKAGTTLRCAGTFTNEGTIAVLLGAEGGYIAVPLAGVGGSATLPAQPGDFGVAAGLPAFDTDGTYSTTIFAAEHGSAATKTYIVSNLTRLRLGGGGGGGGTGSAGGHGGGLIRVFVNGALVNSGRIDAEGESGTGGGGGGIVILASRASIRNAGTITARGGRGLGTDLYNAASGGGGGGIVVLAAPSIENSGVTDIAGGEGGAVTRPLNLYLRAGGGGGGGSGGSGGFGGTVSGETSTAGRSGQPGFVLTLQQDPLFVVN